MLRTFKVSNFKNFKDTLTFELSNVEQYDFNPECIKNNIVNNAIIYGPNGVGKSNLGLAIFDIIEHLTDKNKDEGKYRNYLNAYSESRVAKFDYEFLINNKTINYTYKKTDYKTLVSEQLLIDGKEVVLFDRSNDNNQFTVNLKGAETLNTTINDNQLSALKYVKNNTVLEDNETTRAFYEFFKFVDRMLYFRSLQDRMYLGLNIGIKMIEDDIIENDNVEDFQKFLNDAEIECKLSVVEGADKKMLAFDFGGKNIPFFDIASTGTNALSLFYFWFQRVRLSKVSLLFIDEFDAFYHYGLSVKIVDALKRTGVQFILTTHNTSIMTNDLLRPDCYFLMNKEQIWSLSKSTAKELREAHNIEKMYKAGTFNAY